jgi:hypothetical protein
MPQDVHCLCKHLHREDIESALPAGVTLMGATRIEARGVVSKVALDSIPGLR